MKPPIYIFLNGILNLFNSNDAFTDLGVREVNRRPGLKADKFEAPMTVFSARWKEKARVEAFQEFLEPYLKDFDLRLVGHSWGARIITDFLHATHIDVGEIHLVAAACDADCRKNGLNDAGDRVRLVRIYRSPCDAALKLARAIGWAAGYGCMGLTGPTHASMNLHTKMRVISRERGHMAWGRPPHLAETIELILNP